MTYNTWAKEYEEQMIVLKKRIDNLKEQKRRCRAVCQVDELSRRIQSLYNMYLESKHTADVLRGRANEGILL